MEVAGGAMEDIVSDDSAGAEDIMGSILCALIPCTKSYCGARAR
jgi:hypothetical protein